MSVVQAQAYYMELWKVLVITIILVTVIKVTCWLSVLLQCTSGLHIFLTTKVVVFSIM